VKRLVFDLDNTLTIEGTGDYYSVLPRLDMIEKLRMYKQQGFDIIISTSRNMRTYNASVGKITANTLPVIFEWQDTTFPMMKFMWVNLGVAMMDSILMTSQFDHQNFAH